MRILHCCLSCYYVDGFGYQENYLPLYNQADGHDVMIIASTETFIDGCLGYLQPSAYVTETGIPIERLAYSKVMPHVISKKIRYYPGLMDRLESFKPDVILFHGTSAFDIMTVAQYKANHPSVKLYVDSHEAYYNSAQNIISKYILHGLLYRSWFKRALPYIDKVLFVGATEREYLADMMGLNDSQMELYPLGGIVIDQEEKQRIRNRIFAQHGLDIGQHILMLHSGKLDKQKRTEELLLAFSKVGDPRFRLFVIGCIPEKMHGTLDEMMRKDERITFLGWKSGAELNDYLAAASIYLQPGSVSATLQNAICNGTPVMVYPHASYELYVNENGVRVKTIDDMRHVFQRIQTGDIDLGLMSTAAFSYAHEFLDYRKLAARLYR